MYQSPIEEDDSEFVKNIHGDVSRTFELAAEKLSEDLGDVIRTSYLLCRIPDTIEDSGNIPADKKSDLLNQYLDILQDSSEYEAENFVSNSYEALNRDIGHWREMEEIGSDPDYWRLLENTERVFDVFEQFDDEIRRSVEYNVGEMVEGMRNVSSDIAESEAEGIRIDDFDELADYNYIVAGTVGNLLTDIFTYNQNFDEEDRLYELSEDFGHFLQTINIINDPYDDFVNEDAIFVPNSLAGGDFHQEVEDSFVREDFDNLKLEEGIVELAEHAEESKENVVEYIDIIEEESGEIGGYLQVPALLATANLREARESPGDAFEENGIGIEKAEALTIKDKAGSWKVNNAVNRIDQEPLITWPNRLKARLHDFKTHF
jgi:farnesyl-diphosphate farnesyltransferase